MSIQICAHLFSQRQRLLAFIAIEICKGLFAVGSFDAQPAARHIQCRAYLVNRLLQNDAQLQRLSNGCGNAIDRNLAPGLLLQQVRKLGGHTNGQLQ